MSRRRQPVSRFAFSLIELMIVVAMAALLAAIAVPNITASRSRSAVSRARADLRTLAVAIEGCIADKGVQPRTYLPNGSWSRARVMAQLTTPVAYLSGLLVDPYKITPPPDSRPYFWWGRNPALGPDGFCLGHLDAIRGGFAAAVFFADYPEFYNAATSSYTDANAYLVFSVGPDGQPEVLNPAYPSPICSYDPSNGLISGGDIIRWR